MENEFAAAGGCVNVLSEALKADVSLIEPTFRSLIDSFAENW